MSTHKHIDRICTVAVAASLLLTLLFMNGKALGLRSASQVMGYESKLFDLSRVHTIEIVMDDWDSFLETCENEGYTACSVVIDNEAYKNVGLRAKGNTSLTTVSQMGSDRYSFKLEFDRYDSGKTYYGLDKLCLNNMIQDNTYMKDYLVYRLMGQFGVAAPLCSYVYITVNGEDWGLYLAVEGVEESFLRRNYGRDYGDLYKPDSLSFGGGRGNGRDFDMDDFTERSSSERESGQTGDARQPAQQAAPPEGFGPSSAGSAPPEDFDPSRMFGGGGGGFGGGMGGGFDFGGMGSDDVKLQYTDDDPDSYSNIFSSAKTEVTDADQVRLIQALKELNTGNGAGTLDTDQVLRYFVVHNFVVNGDSYTGSMVHNYYLYEKDGRLSMIPWDYNLAFGTFQGSDASGAVNDPIDSPLSVSGSGERPMADWIFSSEDYTRLYHQYFQQFLDSTDWAAIIDEAYSLIASCVERDPTKFCTDEEFEAGVSALKTFCQLRTESVSGQLAGTIPTTDAGQAADSSTLVDTAGLTLSDMGTMGGDGGAFPGGSFGGEEGGDGTQPGEGDIPVFGNGGGGFRPPDSTGMPGDAPIGGESQSEGSSTGTGATVLVMTGISVAVLLIGLAIAFRFRRPGEGCRGSYCGGPQ